MTYRTIVEPLVVLGDNVPDFTEEEKKTTEAFTYYGDLDDLGRCTLTFANVCPQTQPTEKRGEIGQVRPSGWHTVKYNDLIDGNYLYNRCHLIGYQLTGENANEKNLITGTRYLNVEGMLPFEDMVDAYVDGDRKPCFVPGKADLFGRRSCGAGRAHGSMVGRRCRTGHLL